MIAIAFPLVPSVLLQTTAAPFPMPQTYGEGFLIIALVTVSGVTLRVLTERIKRAESQADAFIATLPELLIYLREWKEAQRDHTNSGRT